MSQCCMCARKDVSASFNEKELELLIDASLNGNRYEEASELLYNKFGGTGYMSGDEIQYQAYEYDKEKYNVGGFSDIDW